MRHLLIGIVLAAGCGHSSSKPKETAEVKIAGDQWQTAADLYFRKIADVMDAAGPDCVKLVEGLKTLDKDSVDLAKVLVDANKELKDAVIEPATAERISKHGDLMDRCEAEKTEGFADAVTGTLFVVEPYKPDRPDSAYRTFFHPK
jgi:hypothetical protein